MESQCKTLIILGMHKSGTSMIAGTLKNLGVNIGKYVTPDWTNPLGHFENKKVVELNDKILEAAEGSWNKPPRIEKILDVKERFSKDIKDLIKREQSSIWGWKDPRTSLTIELYLPYLENPYFLICRREALAIARSLEKRDKIEIEEGIRLTEIYERRIGSFFKEHSELRNLELPYDQIINNPEKWLEKIVNFLKIQATIEQHKEALTFILPEEKKRRAYINYLIRSGIKHPWKIPGFLIRKIRSG